MDTKTLIFIPDISGFTEFVNTTAIEHSQHIISELLEIIVDTNYLNFSISEIEGDAVLFYKKHEIPGVDELINQTKDMFLKFHSHLNEIDKSNVCQCGACRTASNLSLKFIIHLGEIKEVTVNRFNKLIGSDLILAHRLLKNSITSKEYLLLSLDYFNNYMPDILDSEDWVEIQSSQEQIDNFGSVQVKFIDFKPLMDQLPKILEKNKPVTHDRKADIVITIDAPMLLVHDALTDADAKLNFVPGIKKIETDDKINRVNSSHTCVFDNLEIHFVTKNNTVENNKIAYSEEAKLKKNFRFIADYRLVEYEGKTELSLYIFKSKLPNGEKNSLLGKIKEYLFLKFIVFNNRKGIKHFKEYCEKKHRNNI